MQWRIDIAKTDWSRPEKPLLLVGLLGLLVALFIPEVRLGTVVLRLFTLCLMIFFLALMLGATRDGLTTFRQDLKHRRLIVVIVDALPYAGALAFCTW